MAEVSGGVALGRTSGRGRRDLRDRSGVVGGLVTDWGSDRIIISGFGAGEGDWKDFLDFFLEGPVVEMGTGGGGGGGALDLLDFFLRYFLGTFRVSFNPIGLNLTSLAPWTAQAKI